MKKPKKVCIAMSGGVDSSVSAALLKEKGYDVFGAFIVNWSDTKNIKGECAWREERRDAMRVAAKLDIPLLTFNFEQEYSKWVVNYLFYEYQSGRTPNPDIICNKFIKFGLFLKHAKLNGADFIATGHYARVKKRGNEYDLLKGKDKNKDQSYFLYTLDQGTLSITTFPVGDLTKEKVRSLAKKYDLPVSKKPESMGICFIGKVNLEDFLKQKISPKGGNIITVDGKKVGRHKGVFYYTVGQRHGFGIRGGGTYYIVKKDVTKNQLIVAKGKDNPALFKSECVISQLNWLGKISLPLRCKAKIRYRQPDQDCDVIKTDHPKSIMVIFKKPQWAISPGQSIVFYKGDRLLGGGVIN